MQEMRSPRRLLGPMEPHSRRAHQEGPGSSRQIPRLPPHRHRPLLRRRNCNTRSCRHPQSRRPVVLGQHGTFGSPGIGSDHTARFLSKQSTLSYRVTSQNDPIPHMPFLDFGYWHTQPEYWISRNADAPKREDILLLTGYNNRLGNKGHDGLDKIVHEHYFGLVRSCSS